MQVVVRPALGFTVTPSSRYIGVVYSWLPDASLMLDTIGWTMPLASTGKIAVGSGCLIPNSEPACT